MMPFVFCLAAAAAAQRAPAPQEFTEVRFHRVHLRNGNFVDGDLARQTDRDVTLRVKSGEITLRNDLIARAENGALRIELVKIRGLKETPPPPKEIEEVPPAPPRRDPFERPPAIRRPPPDVRPAPPTEGGNEAVDRILRQLATAEPDRRDELMDALIDLGAPAALYLASSMERLNEEGRSLAATALARMGEDAVLPAVRKLLSSRDPSLRHHAAAILGSLGSAPDAALLHPLLQDPEPLVRRSTAIALKRLNSPESFDPIAGLCLDDESSVRQLAIEVLFELARNEDLAARLEETLSGTLGRAREEARADLVSAVGRSGRKDLWRLPESHLSDDDAGVRAQAVSALTLLNVKEAEPSLLPRFEAEEDESVREHLAFAAEKLRIRKAVPRLIGWLEGEEKAPFKQAAHRALRQLTNQNLPPDHGEWAAWWEKAKPPE